MFLENSYYGGNMKDIVEVYDREKNKKIDIKIFLLSLLSLVISVFSVLLGGNKRSFSGNIIELISLILIGVMGLVYMVDEYYKGKYFLKFIRVVLLISLPIFCVSLAIFVNKVGSMEELYRNKPLFFYLVLINNGINLLILPYYFQHYKKLSYIECMKNKLKYLEKK